MYELFLFFFCLAAIFPVSLLDVKRFCWPRSYADSSLLFFLFDVVKSFVYFFVCVAIGCSLALMPVLFAILLHAHDRILGGYFSYRYYSIFAVLSGFLLFFVPGLLLLDALVFFISFLVSRHIRYSFVVATIGMPCFAYFLYSYLFFKFCVCLVFYILTHHYVNYSRVYSSDRRLSI